MRSLSRIGTVTGEQAATSHRISLSAFGRLPIRAGTWTGTRIAARDACPVLGEWI